MPQASPYRTDQPTPPQNHALCRYTEDRLVVLPQAGSSVYQVWLSVAQSWHVFLAIHYGATKDNKHIGTMTNDSNATDLKLFIKQGKIMSRIDFFSKICM